MPRKRMSAAELAANLAAKKIEETQFKGSTFDDDDGWDISEHSSGELLRRQENISACNALLDLLIRYHADKLYNKLNNE